MTTFEELLASIGICTVTCVLIVTVGKIVTEAYYFYIIVFCCICILATVFFYHYFDDEESSNSHFSTILEKRTKKKGKIEIRIHPPPTCPKVVPNSPPCHAVDGLGEKCVGSLGGTGKGEFDKLLSTQKNETNHHLKIKDGNFQRKSPSKRFRSLRCRESSKTSHHLTSSLARSKSLLQSDRRNNYESSAL